MCGSRNPGVTSSLEASIWCVLGGIRIDSGTPTAVIVFPSINSRPGENFLSGASVQPASIQTKAFLLTSASEVCHHIAKISIRSCESFLGFLTITPGRAHDHRDL